MGKKRMSQTRYETSCFIFHFTGTVSCFSFQASLWLHVYCFKGFMFPVFQVLYVSNVSNASCFMFPRHGQKDNEPDQIRNLNPLIWRQHSDHCTMMGWLEELQLVPNISVVVSGFMLLYVKLLMTAMTKLACSLLPDIGDLDPFVHRGWIKLVIAGWLRSGISRVWPL